MVPLEIQHKLLSDFILIDLEDPMNEFDKDHSIVSDRTLALGTRMA